MSAYTKVRLYKGPLHQKYLKFKFYETSNFCYAVTSNISFCKFQNPFYKLNVSLFKFEFQIKFKPANIQYRSYLDLMPCL
jgi:hypothetical protein